MKAQLVTTGHGTWRQYLVRVVMVLQSDILLQVVVALRPPRDTAPPGSSGATGPGMPMIAITTNNSTRVKPLEER